MINVNTVKNFKELDTGTQILLTLISIASDKGDIRTNKSTLAKYLGKSRETVALHINRYVRTNILKYKYSGLARINPEFYFSGTDAERAEAIRLYHEFKSDVM